MLWLALISPVIALPQGAAGGAPASLTVTVSGGASTVGILNGNAYAPKPATCPSSQLVRKANCISAAESAWINSRKPIASAALAAWLSKTGVKFGKPSTYPTLGLATSGGGLRSLLTGAGVVQSFDSRDSNDSTSGLYQALTYESGLSGGGWMLNSLAGNNWPTITALKTTIWENAFSQSLLVAQNFVTSDAYGMITQDVVAKQTAGYETTLIDVYGRTLSYDLLNGTDGGVMDTMSGLAGLSNFTGYHVPFPITTAIGVDTDAGQCLPPNNGTQYEFSPFEFGSWDKGVAAFVQTKYLGSNLSNGKPASSSCTVNYDNLGYIMGTTSDVFAAACGPNLPQADNSSLVGAFESVLYKAHQAATTDVFALYPNPFYNYSSSSLVSNDTELYLVDGGLSNQNDPIWPLLHRKVDVLFVNDNSADTSDNYPNGTEIYTTYVQATSQGVPRMPVIPPVSVFVANGYNKRPTFFGCNSKDVMTIIYIPNVNYTYPSGQSTYKLQYSPAETDAMIANGVLVGDYNGNSTWGKCVGCAVMKKTGASLPAVCASCFSTFCYN